jgi:Oxidoreductase FAD-binding domain
MIKGPNDADGKVVAKPYTPTTLSDEKGHFELVVKVYPGGKVSGHLHGLKVCLFGSECIVIMYQCYPIYYSMSGSIAQYRIVYRE